MPGLRVTVADLRAITTAVYGLDPKHAPSDVWVDHFDEGWSFVRATYRGEFCAKCCRRLLRVVSILRATSGNDPTVTVVIYLGGPETLPEDRQDFIRGRLGFRAGFNEGTP